MSVGKVHITVMDGLGRVVYQATKYIQGADVEIDLSTASFKAGVYIIQWQHENGAGNIVRAIKR
jgi:hypothetical protein